MDKTRLALEKRLMEHRAQVETVKKGYRFDPQDTNTYNLATAISRGDMKARAKLIADWLEAEIKREQWHQRQHHIVFDGLQLQGE